MHSGSVFRYRVVVYRSGAGAVDIAGENATRKSIYLIGSNERATLYSGINLVGC